MGVWLHVVHTVQPFFDVSGTKTATAGSGVLPKLLCCTLSFCHFTPNGAKSSAHVNPCKLCTLPARCVQRHVSHDEP